MSKLKMIKINNKILKILNNKLKMRTNNNR